MVDGISFSSKHNRDAINALFKLALCACMVSLVSCVKYPDDPGWVATELVEAFVAADTERAKSVTVSEQWGRIEEWTEGRQPFKCRGGSFMDLTGTVGSGNYSVTGSEWTSRGLVYQCGSTQTPYCLEINDIQVRETEDGWKVYDWGKVCEAFDYAYRCGEICDR